MRERKKDRKKEGRKERNKKRENERPTERTNKPTKLISMEPQVQPVCGLMFEHGPIKYESLLP